MARKLRVQYPGALYHLMNRGDRREPIFKDADDRRRFLETLGQACGKTGWQVHAYCLMLNHFHLVVETPDANLVAGMRWLLSSHVGTLYRMMFKRTGSDYYRNGSDRRLVQRKRFAFGCGAVFGIIRRLTLNSA